MTSSSLGMLITNDQLLRSMPNIALALFLIHERSQSSKWKPYIDILPNHFTTPLYFDYDQLNRLKSSAALCKTSFISSFICIINNYLGDVLTHIQRIARQYCYLHNLLKVNEILKISSFYRIENFLGTIITFKTR